MGLDVPNLGFRVGCRVQGSRLRVEDFKAFGLGLWVWDLEFRLRGLPKLGQGVRGDGKAIVRIAFGDVGEFCLSSQMCQKP